MGKNKIQMKLILIISALLFMGATCSTIPKIDNYKYQPTNRPLPLNIALIISSDFKTYVYRDSVEVKCVPYGHDTSSSDKYIPLIEGRMSVQNEVGIAASELLSKSMPSLFRSLDIFESLPDIEKLEKYDYIIVPRIDIKTTYDRKKALSLHYEKYDSFEKRKFPVTVKARFHFQIGIREHVIDTLDSDEHSIQGYGQSDQCDPARNYVTLSWENRYSRFLSVKYHDMISTAMVDAFNDIMAKTESYMKPLVGVEH